MPDCNDPVTDQGLKNSVPWSDPAEACPVGIPDNTAVVSFVNGQPVFALAPGVGSAEGGGGTCPPVPPPAVEFVSGAENLGDGEGLFSQLVGGVLQFLSLKFGSGFTVSSDGSSLLIDLIDSGVVSWDDILSKPSEFPPSAHTHTLADITDAGSAAGADSTDFATAAQGALADTAIQPADLGSAAYESTAAFATAAQGALAASAIQPQLTENNPILFDAALSADGQYSGFCIAGTAGATLAFGDLCYLAVADSRWELANAGAAATAGGVMLGICVLAAASDGDPTRLLLVGNVRADAAFPTLTIGAPAYVSTTSGDIQVAQPSTTDEVIRICGHALTADELFFNPSRDWMTAE